MAKYTILVLLVGFVLVSISSVGNADPKDVVVTTPVTFEPW